MVVLISAQCACKKLVEIPPPVNQLTTENVFNNDATATAAQLNIYNKMNGIGANIELQAGLSSDELKTYDAAGTNLNCYYNALTAINDANNIGTGLWGLLYNFIYQENAVIDGLSKYPGVSAPVKKQLIGEAEFTRALNYFYLTSLYGDVPLVTTSDYKASSVASRTAKDLVYKQIITDLTDAQLKLNTNFVDASDTIKTSERVRPTKTATAALLARIYLYKADYPNAESQATQVINNAAFPLKLETDVTRSFLKNSSETIWALMPPPTQYFTEGGTFILYTDPQTQAEPAISSQLLSTFEASDLRKVNWLQSITVTGATYYYPYKYKAWYDATSQSEYYIVLRLAEQYLIRAEARAWQDKTTDAIADLNVIRNRAGLVNYTGPTDRASLINAISHERQVELFVEWGDRWLNLKRTGTIDQVMSVMTPQKGGTSWQPFQALYPIPLTDIQNDHNLKQTPGY